MLWEENPRKAKPCQWFERGVSRGRSTTYQDFCDESFGEKIRRLKEIVDIASYAIEETEKLQQKFLDVEVEYMNNINSRAEQRDER